MPLGSSHVLARTVSSYVVSLPSLLPHRRPPLPTAFLWLDSCLSSVSRLYPDTRVFMPPGTEGWAHPFLWLMPVNDTLAPWGLGI